MKCVCVCFFLNRKIVHIIWHPFEVITKVDIFKNIFLQFKKKMMGPNKCCFVWKSIFTTIYIYIYIKRENRSQNYYAEQFTKNTIWITCFSFFLIQVLWLNLLNVSMQFVNCVVQLVIWMWWRDWWVVIVFFSFFFFLFSREKEERKKDWF